MLGLRGGSKSQASKRKAARSVLSVGRGNGDRKPWAKSRHNTTGARVADLCLHGLVSGGAPPGVVCEYLCALGAGIWKSTFPRVGHRRSASRNKKTHTRRRACPLARSLQSKKSFFFRKQKRQRLISGGGRNCSVACVVLCLAAVAVIDRATITMEEVESATEDHTDDAVDADGSHVASPSRVENCTAFCAHIGLCKTQTACSSIFFSQTQPPHILLSSASKRGSRMLALQFRI